VAAGAAGEELSHQHCKKNSSRRDGFNGHGSGLIQLCAYLFVDANFIVDKLQLSAY
jgi:hypothetical protein